MKVFPSQLHGSVTIPPSKSAAHRAIIAASLAKGRSIVSNIDLSSDIKATINACRALGCRIEVVECLPFSEVIIDGGISIKDVANIDCAESGSTLRFMIPIACAVAGKKVFSGSGRLPQRPIDAYYEIFSEDRIEYKKPEDKNLPLEVDGILKGGEYVIDGKVSSQYITGMLFALPMLRCNSAVIIKNELESKGYVDLTVNVLRSFGVDIKENANSYLISGGQEYQPFDYSVEGDFSQAAFFLAGGCISGDICVAGLREDSLQPDKAIVDILRRMGANIEYTQLGLCAAKSRLKGIEVNVSQCPDLVPPIAVAAAIAEGRTDIVGAQRLRIKESDRLTAVADNLNNFGIKTEVRDDGMTIYGGTIKGGRVDSYNDHRITMAFAIAALCASGEVQIDGHESINKSYPGFFKDYTHAGGKIS